MEQQKIPVLIVGGGPVGLSLAMDLGLAGVPCTLIEQSDGRIATPKMNLLNTRSMEYCRRWGLVDEVKAAGPPEENPLDVVFVTSMRGLEIVRHRMPSYVQRGELPHSPEGSRRCSQYFFDPMLLKKVSALPGVTLRHRVRLNSLQQDANEVRVTLTDLASGRTETLRADYVAGCDGPASTVRETLGISQQGSPMLDANISVFFRSAELPSLHDKGWATFYRIVGREGIVGNLNVINGRDLWRMSLMKIDPNTDMRQFDPREPIRRAVGCDFNFEVISSALWVRRKLVADRYRVGRVFLAGDSCHQLSPTGGFGMNTGLGDANNLAWKLTAAIRGWGGAALLDSYEIERRPIAVRNSEEANRNLERWELLPGGDDIANDSAAGRAQRAAFAAAFDNNDEQRHYDTEGVALGYRYCPSPIVIDDGTPPPADDTRIYIQTSRPGHRAPHAWMADGRSTIDLYGDGFVLLRSDAQAPPAGELAVEAGRRGIPFAAVQCTEPAIGALYPAKLTLVRPDGHVAWRGEQLPSDCGRLWDTVTGRTLAQECSDSRAAA